MARFTFPDREDLPASRDERVLVPPVPSSIALDLWMPIVDVAFDRPPIRAVWGIMAVPKAAVDENDFPATCEHKVRLAFEVLPVEPVSVAEGKDRLSDDLLRLRPMTLNPTHVLGTGRRCELVHHEFSYQSIYR